MLPQLQFSSNIPSAQYFLQHLAAGAQKVFQHRVCLYAEFIGLRWLLKRLWHRAHAPELQGSSGYQLSSPGCKIIGILLVNWDPSGSEPRTHTHKHAQSEEFVV